ncbi:MAG: sigma-70 family RNA polymerase sigma factor [Bacteroidetes bacterium]|nr:sigma-70 family RNA polymerase sigma factor [Fibrella sp.]
MILPESLTIYRPILVAIAYRMTGQVMISEDIVQEAIVRWMNRPPETIIDPKAYLAKSVTNGCLNYLAKVKHERDAYKGVWLPEPFFTNSHVIDAQIDVSYGLMVLLEKLTPLERAVFVLRESFDFGYAELAQLFAVTEANCRQLYHRATEKVVAKNRRFVIDPHQQESLLAAFVTASQTGDTDLLIRLLKTHVEVYTDGGGKVSAAINPLFGSAIVSRFLQSLARKQSGHFTTQPTLMNGQVGILYHQIATQQLTSVLVMEVDITGISRLFFVRNPDKLAHLNQLIRSGCHKNEFGLS